MIFFTQLKSLYLSASALANAAFESLSLLFMRLLVAKNNVHRRYQRARDR